MHIFANYRPLPCSRQGRAGGCRINCYTTFKKESRVCRSLQAEVLADPVGSSPLGARDAASAAWALAQASVARADLVEAVRGGSEAGGVGAQCREGVGCFRAF